MPPPDPDWQAVTAALDGELRAWEAYAAEARRWADGLRARLGAGLAPTAAHVRVGGVEAPGRLAEHTEWVAASAERIARALRERLAAGDVPAAALLAVAPGPSARGFDYRAPGFFHAPHRPGDLRAPWTVPDPERTGLLREALFPEVGLRSGPGPRAAAYAAWLRREGNPWA